MRKIPFSPPDITRLEIEEVVDTLTSGWITKGHKKKLFEKKIAEYCGTSKAAAMNSATACLELTLRLLGIGPGDEVITSAYTYTASASVIHHVGAKIVLVDTGKNSFHINYDAIADAITEKTKAIIPVDIAGIMCDYDKIFDVIESKKSLFRPANEIQEAIDRVAVIGDAAHSFGASRNGVISGQAADFTCFSFHAVKNLTASEGGAVTWRDIPGIDNEDIYRQFMLLSLHGQSKDALAKTEAGSWEYDIICLGYKFNMPDIMASIGLRQLQRYPEILEKRRRIIEIYDANLSNCDNVALLKHYGDTFTSSGHLYLVRLLGKDEAYRNMVIQKMAEKGIAANVHFKPLPLFTAYKNLGFDIRDYPNAYRQYANEITLPLHTLLSEEDVEYVCENFKRIIES